MSKRDADLEAAFEAGLIETVRREAMAVFGTNQEYPCHDVMAMKAEIDRQNNRYAEMSAEADRLSKMVTAFREQDDAIRAEFGGKRDGRPTIECIWEAFNAKWREEDALFKATLDMKTAELRAEAARLAAENEKLRTALQEAFEVYANSEGFIPETAAEGYQQQVIKQIMDCINVGLTALQDKSEE